MREICLRNQRMLKILSGITETVFEENNLKRLSEEASKIRRTDKLIQEFDPWEDSYFRRALMLPIKDFGYPRSTFGVGTLSIASHHSNFFHNIIGKKLMRLQTTIGAPQNALCMLYPKSGYIGWHHNGNAPGYNVLFSYSQDGKGYFKYYDKDKDEVVYMYDKPGWNVKCGYYPSEVQEPKRIYWHSAYTENERLSIAFVINNRDMWINMIEYITDNDFDREFIQSQGPLKDLKKHGYA